MYGHSLSKVIKIILFYHPYNLFHVSGYIEDKLLKLEQSFPRMREKTILKRKKLFHIQFIMMKKSTIKQVKPKNLVILIGRKV